MLRRLLFLVALGISTVCLTAPDVDSAETAPSSQVAWRLLDYVAVDYPGAVENGGVVSTSEYAEMVEFSASVRDRLATLPVTGGQPQLIAEADQLKAAIARKAPGAEVADRARRLAAEVLEAYPIPLAPMAAPNLRRAKGLYTQECAGCHGLTGRGDGPNAKAMNPRPIAFTDLERARQRSVFGLYQVISQGLDGTAMASFDRLPSQDRWALAFYVGRFAFGDGQSKAGKRRWEAEATLRDRVADMEALTQTTPATLAQDIGEAPADQVMAYLRRHPEALSQHGTGGLAVARLKLAEALAAYQSGDRKRAQELALAAYLDGFEPVEPALKARDPALLTRIEAAMGGLRAGISKGAPVPEVRAMGDRVVALLNASERALSPEKASAVSSFAGAFAILLREGVEALLIIVAIIAFLRKADRKDVLAYVHGGWISALVAGGATWLAATYLISISGASRELTEGFGSLISALVLISVGVWMHGKSHADAWQTYIRTQLSAALSKRSAWFLFLLAFVVVYREVFETILFYAALWSQGAQLALLAGAGSAVLTLALIAWALLSYSKRLPISLFFAYSSLLISILAVVLAGKGVAALQEAGLLGIQPLSLMPRIEVLGMFPTIEGLAAQLTALAVIGVGFSFNRHRPGAT